MTKTIIIDQAGQDLFFKCKKVGVVNIDNFTTHMRTFKRCAPYRLHLFKEEINSLEKKEKTLLGGKKFFDYISSLCQE